MGAEHSTPRPHSQPQSQQPPSRLPSPHAHRSRSEYHFNPHQEQVPQPYATSRRYLSPKPGHPSRKKRTASPIPIPAELLAVPKAAGGNTRPGLGSKRHSMFGATRSTSTFSLASMNVGSRPVSVINESSMSARGGESRNSSRSDGSGEATIRAGLFPYFEESGESEDRKDRGGERKKRGLRKSWGGMI